LMVFNLKVDRQNHLKNLKPKKMTRLQFNDSGFRSLGDLVSDILNDAPLAKANSFFPRANIYETKDDYQIEMLVPSRKKEDFKISLEKNLLTISFEAKEEEKNTEKKLINKEFSIRSFNRSFTIDEKINPEGIVAKYEDGVLTLALPKKEEVKALPKEIAIQ